MTDDKKFDYCIHLLKYDIDRWSIPIPSPVTTNVKTLYKNFMEENPNLKILFKKAKLSTADNIVSILVKFTAKMFTAVQTFKANTAKQMIEKYRKEFFEAVA